MIDELRAMAVFAKTAECGSFRMAAKELHLSPSVVSHHISQLERRLGVALLYRSTRRLSLTDHGTRLFAAARQMLAAAETGLNEIKQTQEEASGKLRLTLPSMLANHPVTRHIAAFANRYTRVSLDINYSDHPQDLIRDSIDLAIRIGPLKDSSLKSRKLFDMPRALVASTSFLQRQSKLKKPEDLTHWDWIGLSTRSGRKDLQHPKRGVLSIEIKPRISADSMEAVYQLCLAGLGLCTPPMFMVEKDIQEGQLAMVSPPWHPPSLGVYAVWPPNASYNQLAMRLVAFMIDQIESSQAG
ncbi:transcriptional regulator [Hahella sp. CCB-MM4]|uniref:LysR family transcriptional regulator n=1 Tax=Hahella sp. (strain CCB-MM4) TaxID=1926491 RepID=UPI000B9A673E|nr:LysR family transcriptional regulator [Hahella sp. CCB-MM4]OZG74529.1 transcriptional regulator [Hahella sp. CCB-MM4]